MKKTYYFLLTKSIGFYINILSFIAAKKATQMAHGYFSEPRKGKFTKENIPQALQEAQSEIIHSNEDTIQTYIWKGNDTVVVLIHGWESNSSRWKKMLPYLKKSGSTIIAIDGPAQGLSSGKEFTAPKYAEFIDIVCQKYQPNYIIGHSMGGMTSLYYQHKYQNTSIKKIVLLGSPFEINIFLQNFTNLLSLNSKIYKSLVEKYESFFNIILADFNAAHFTKSIAVKGLIVHDINDEIVFFEEGKKIADAWKESEFVETSGLGHKLQDKFVYQKIYHFLFESEIDDLQSLPS